MPIHVWDYRDELEVERPDIIDAVDRVLQSGRLILGESVRSFEEEFASYCGVRFGVGVNSGTDALMLALIALGIQPGDEVLTVANTAIPTISAIVSAGAVPRFVDIVPGTYLMDTERIASAITTRVTCILPVHLFGQCVDMNPVLDIARQRGVKLLEDCAQSHGARYRGRLAGSMGDAAAFSFYPTKVLGGCGDGGMVLTSSEPVTARVRRLRVYGTEGTYYAVEHGYNSRLDELQAEILRTKLRRLDEYIARRRAVAARYDALLAGSGLLLPETAAHNVHTYHLYVVRHPQRDRIVAEMSRHDIMLSVHYPWPVHVMPAYQRFGYRAGSLPHTEAAAREIFSLPMYPSLAADRQDHVCDRLRHVMANL